MARQSPWKVAVEPVKWSPASSGLARAASPTTGPGPGTKLTTPGGSPAASRSFISLQAERTAVDAGFQTTAFPMIAGAVGRFAAIEVKLKGVTARTNPSSGRYSIRFHWPGGEMGWSARIRSRKWTLNRQKSIDSQTASISAWNDVLDWPTMVAALSTWRHGPARS